MKPIDEIYNRLDRVRDTRETLQGADDRGDGWIDGYATALEWALNLSSTSRFSLSRDLSEFEH